MLSNGCGELSGTSITPMPPAINASATPNTSSGCTPRRIAITPSIGFIVALQEASRLSVKPAATAKRHWPRVVASRAASCTAMPASPSARA